MSRISQCASYSGRLTPALPLDKMLQIIAAIAIALFFLVAHLNLRFSVNKLKSETIRLQLQHDKLQGENNALVARNEALKQPERLLAYARHEIGMVPISVTEQEKIVVPASLSTKYALASAARAQGPTLAEDRVLQERAVWLSALGERVGLSSNVQAKEKN